MWLEVALFLLAVLGIDIVVEVLPGYLQERARRITPLAAFPDWEEHIRPFEAMVPGEIWRTGRDNWPALADAWALEASLRGFQVEWKCEGVLPDGWQIRVPEDYNPGRWVRPAVRF